MKVVGIIPARYKSSRFPGKPLANLDGKPMIWWVHDQCIKVKGLDEIFVATDDERIKSACEELGIKAVMTSSDHRTGTDRVCEAASNIDAALFVNIQGDEPLIDPSMIDDLIKSSKNGLSEGFEIFNLMTRIEDLIELPNTNVVKVVVNQESKALYLSRQPIPYPRGRMVKGYFKQIGVYCFTKKALNRFLSLEQGPAEKAEEIEILRFIEYNMDVKMIEVKNMETYAVDTPGDLRKVEMILESRKVKRNDNVR